MNKEQLDTILKEHNAWVSSNGSEGKRANLRNANLRNADLRNADLYNANLYNADLRNANLENADLYNANLYNADLRNANLENANLRNANLENANLYNLNILTFQFNNHFAYSHSGRINIGCKDETIEWWLENYKQVGENEEYSELEIDAYGDFIKLCDKINKQRKEVK